jgi:hypothetical protein
MEAEGSFLGSQQPATSLYHKKDASSPHHPTLVSQEPI